SADLGNTAVFPALCSGGVLHVISSERAMDPAGWRQYLEAHPIDCLKIVPSHLSALLGSAEGEAARAALPQRVLVLGGEASSWELIERVQRAAPELRVINHYGPTETTVGVLTYEVRKGIGYSVLGIGYSDRIPHHLGPRSGHPPNTQYPTPNTRSATVPLGRPLANNRVYLLNEQG